LAILCRRGSAAHDDPAAAKKKLDALLANAPSDAPWRQIVADRLAELSQNVGAAPSVRASDLARHRPRTRPRTRWTSGSAGLNASSNIPQPNSLGDQWPDVRQRCSCT